MFEIKFMTGFSCILWKDWQVTCVSVAQALLLKARTTPKEMAQWPLLWDGLSQHVLDPGCATTDVPLRPADGSARTTSPTAPQARIPKKDPVSCQTPRLPDVFTSNRYWIRHGVVSSCNPWLFPWARDSLSFLPHWILGEQEVASGLPMFCEFLCEGPFFIPQLHPWEQKVRTYQS